MTSNPAIFQKAIADSTDYDEQFDALLRSGSSVPDAYWTMVVDDITDALAGKRTLAVRLGRRGTQAEYVLLIALALVVPPIGVLALRWPVAALAALLAGPLAAPPLRAVLTHVLPQELLPALGGTARMLAAYGIALAAGLAFG